MSLTAGDVGGLRTPKLHGRNFPEWIEHVKDYIITLNADNAPDMWDAYEWDLEDQPVDAEDPADRDCSEIPALGDDNADEGKQAKMLRLAHNETFRFIRSHLSETAFNTTVDRKLNVPQLLLHLRTMFYDDPDGTYRLSRSGCAAH